MAEPIAVLDVHSTELEPWGMSSDQLIAGQPEMAFRSLYRAADDRTWIAVWTSTEGSFWSQYAGDEMIHFVEGRATITDQDGRRATYGTGQAVLIRAGSRCVWEIEEPVRMLFHYQAAGGADQ